MTKTDIEILNNINSHPNKQNSQKLRAAFFRNKLWREGSTINIAFMEMPPQNLIRTPYTPGLIDKNGNLVQWDPLTPQVQNMEIIEAIKLIVMERIQPIVNLKLKFVNNLQGAQIRIAFNPNAGAWSFLGTDNYSIPMNEPTMNFGWFDVATVIHEFGHAIGMVHEHQSPFENKIKWNTELIYKWAEETQGWNREQTYMQIFNQYTKNELSGTPFDPKSIMLYFFPNKFTLDNKGTSMNVRLSKEDVIFINSKYPNSKETPDEFYERVYGGGDETVTTYNPVTTYAPVTTYEPVTLKPLVVPVTYAPTTMPPVIETTPTIQTTFPTLVETQIPIQTTEAPLIIPDIENVKTGTDDDKQEISNPSALSPNVIAFIIFILVVVVPALIAAYFMLWR